MKKALIVTAFADFIRAFLVKDIHILQDMGYEVHCAGNGRSFETDITGFLKENGTVFHEIDFSSNRPFSLSSLRCYRQLVDLLKKERFDAVFLHTPIPGVIGRAAAAKYRKDGLKVVYTTHGFYFHKGSSFKTKLVYKTIETVMSAFTDAIITINREDFTAAKKMHCGNAYYLPGMGVDLERYRNCRIDRGTYRKSLGIPDNSFVVLSIGELSHRKNHIVIIDALGELDIPEAVFVICGRAYTEEDTTEALLAEATEKRVKLIMTGFRSDIPEICRCADIGVLPSKREGLGLAGIEMLASGLPIVASEVHGIVDYVIDGFNGYLANPNDGHDFAEKIKKLYDPEMRKTIALNCSASVENYSMDKSTEALKKIFSDILEIDNNASEEKNAKH